MTYKNDSMQLETHLPVKEVMRSHVNTIDDNATVAEAALRMCSKEPSGSCIVLRDSIPVGIVTEQDINCKVVARDKKPGKVLVKEIMTTPLITLHGDKTVEEAARLMTQKRVRRLPLVDDHGEVIGIVTVRDIVAVATTINELMENLIEINRSGEGEFGMCSRCGKMTDQLRNADSQLLCPACYEEERL
ncbi:MAG: CBS domain-containing protein [Methanospirillaceae archaeon]|nr:CBS domain-containing protein [Methanospirillaceae archaeon]